MRRGAAVWILAVFLGLVIVGLWRQGDARDLTPTSFGLLPAGHRAVYELLSQLGLAVARSYAPPAQLPAQASVWWIEPERPCQESAAKGEASAGEQEEMAEPGLDGAGLERFVTAGGTALVFLPPDPKVCAEGATLGSLAVPARGELSQESGTPRGAPAGSPAGQGGESAEERETSVRVEGELVPRPRTLELPTPLGFEEGPAGVPEGGAGPHWEVMARAEGRPFVLRQKRGQGQLVLIADARFVRNSGLDRADAAPLVGDLVRAYGTPWIDEQAHGLVNSQGALAYLVASPAAPFLAGAAILALAFVWFQAATPPRRVAELDPSAPSLDAFVGSLAACYAYTRDYARVFQRFRELTLRRLRRHFGLPVDAPESRLIECLRQRSALVPDAVDLLARGTAPRSAAELEVAVRQVDRLVRGVVQ